MFVKPRLSNDIHAPISLPTIKTLHCRSPSKPQINAHSTPRRSAARTTTDTSLADLLQIKQHKMFDKNTSSSRSTASKASTQTALSKSPSNAQAENQVSDPISLLEDDNLLECSNGDIEHDHYFGVSRVSKVQTIPDQDGQSSIMLSGRSPSKIGGHYEATFLNNEDSVFKELSGFIKAEGGALGECSFLNAKLTSSGLLDDTILNH